MPKCVIRKKFSLKAQFYQKVKKNINSTQDSLHEKFIVEFLFATKLPISIWTRKKKNATYMVDVFMTKQNTVKQQS